MLEVVCVHVMVYRYGGPVVTFLCDELIVVNVLCSRHYGTSILLKAMAKLAF